MAAAAGDLMKSGSQTVLLKGGRLRGKEVVDLQLQRGAEKMRMSSLRMEGRNIHGMGCTLSSAIACHLALGHELSGAVRSPRSYAFQAIAQGADVQTGRGHGPLNHVHAPRPMQKLPNEDGLIILGDEFRHAHARWAAAQCRSFFESSSWLSCCCIAALPAPLTRLSGVPLGVARRSAIRRSLNLFKS
jgi:hypothetical protein